MLCRRLVIILTEFSATMNNLTENALLLRNIMIYTAPLSHWTGTVEAAMAGFPTFPKADFRMAVCMFMSLAPDYIRNDNDRMVEYERCTWTFLLDLWLNHSGYAAHPPMDPLMLGVAWSPFHQYVAYPDSLSVRGFPIPNQNCAYNLARLCLGADFRVAFVPGTNASDLCERQEAWSLSRLEHRQRFADSVLSAQAFPAEIAGIVMEYGYDEMSISIQCDLPTLLDSACAHIEPKLARHNLNRLHAPFEDELYDYIICAVVDNCETATNVAESDVLPAWAAAGVCPLQIFGCPRLHVSTLFLSFAMQSTETKLAISSMISTGVCGLLTPYIAAIMDGAASYLGAPFPSRCLEWMAQTHPVAIAFDSGKKTFFGKGGKMPDNFPHCMATASTGVRSVYDQTTFCSLMLPVMQRVIVLSVSGKYPVFNAMAGHEVELNSGFVSWANALEKLNKHPSRVTAWVSALTLITQQGPYGSSMARLTGLSAQVENFKFMFDATVAGIYSTIKREACPQEARKVFRQSVEFFLTRHQLNGVYHRRGFGFPFVHLRQLMYDGAQANMMTRPAKDPVAFLLPPQLGAFPIEMCKWYGPVRSCVALDYLATRLLHSPAAGCTWFTQRFSRQNELESATVVAGLSGTIHDPQYNIHTPQ